MILPHRLHAVLTLKMLSRYNKYTKATTFRDPFQDNCDDLQSNTVQLLEVWIICTRIHQQFCAQYPVLTCSMYIYDCSFIILERIAHKVHNTPSRFARWLGTTAITQQGLCILSRYLYGRAPLDATIASGRPKWPRGIGRAAVNRGHRALPEIQEKTK